MRFNLKDSGPSRATTSSLGEVTAVGLGLCVVAAAFVDWAGVLAPPPRATDTSADSRFINEFPNFEFTKRGDCSIMTDAPTQETERILRSLTQFRAEFEKYFSPLIRNRPAARGFQIIYFSSEQPFRDYARRAVPALANSAGFYSSAEHRLVLLNQLGTAQFAHVQNRLKERQQSLSDPAAKPAGIEAGEDRVQASTQLAALRTEMAAEAEAMTERLVRHEAAHQLFDAYKIQSPLAAEPTWLTEGLAEYCETSEIGAYHSVMAHRIAKARAADKLLPMKKLLNHRDPAGFFSLGEKQTEVAYAQSWALIYFFMHNHYRAGFLEFIKYYRDLPDQRAAAAAIGTDTEFILEHFLKTDIRTIQSKWQNFLNHL
jgi:hypothetical protein